MRFRIWATSLLLPLLMTPVWANHHPERCVRAALQRTAVLSLPEVEPILRWGGRLGLNLEASDSQLGAVVAYSLAPDVSEWLYSVHRPILDNWTRVAQQLLESDPVSRVAPEANRRTAVRIVREIQKRFDAVSALLTSRSESSLLLDAAELKIVLQLYFAVVSFSDWGRQMQYDSDARGASANPQRFVPVYSLNVGSTAEAALRRLLDTRPDTEMRAYPVFTSGSVDPLPPHVLAYLNQAGVAPIQLNDLGLSPVLSHSAGLQSPAVRDADHLSYLLDHGQAGRPGWPGRVTRLERQRALRDVITGVERLDGSHQRPAFEYLLLMSALYWRELDWSMRISRGDAYRLTSSADRWIQTAQTLPDGLDLAIRRLMSERPPSVAEFSQFGRELVESMGRRH